MVLEQFPTEKPAYEVYTSDDERITYIIYRGHVTGEITRAVYQTLGRLMESATEATLKNIQGCIFDFSETTRIDVEAMTAAARKSVSFRLTNAHLVTNIPTAILVKTVAQEVILISAMKLARQYEHPRFQMVKSIAEAKRFFAEYNAKRRAEQIEN